MSSLTVDEKRMLRESIASYLVDQYSYNDRKSVTDSERPSIINHWKVFADDLGLLGLGFPENVGGLGGCAAEHALVMEQFGTALVIEPYLSSIVIGGGFLKRGCLESAPDIIQGMIAGDVNVAFAHGEPSTRYNLSRVSTSVQRDGQDYLINGQKSVVLDLPWASHIIISARSAGKEDDSNGLSLFLVDVNADGIERRDFRTISGGVAADITLTNVRAPGSSLITPEGEAFSLIEQVIDEATAVLCAEAIGVMDKLIGDTATYLKERRQFGKPLASFQALQHIMADMLIAREHSSAITDQAISSLSSSGDTRSRTVSAAKVFVGKSIRFISQQAIQLHGGIGTTDELAVGAFFKRALEIERQFGDLDYHLARFERLSYAAHKI